MTAEAQFLAATRDHTMLVPWLLMSVSRPVS